MEKLLNEFVVHRSIEAAWSVLTDLQRIAPCLPGAELHDVEGDVYHGVVKLKLGPVAAAFKGQAQFLERDDAGHRAVLKGEGRDTGGKGNASAIITAELTAISDSSTKCTVATDLKISGKVAQFGRGIMTDVSEKLMTQFATNLNAMLAEETPAAETPRAAGEATGAAAPAPAPTTVGAGAEPIDLGQVAGGAVLKRLLPLFGGLVILLLALRRLRK